MLIFHYSCSCELLKNPTSLPLDLVKAPQQIETTLRRLEQVQGPGQKHCKEPVWCLHVNKCLLKCFCSKNNCHMWVFTPLWVMCQ